MSQIITFSADAEFAQKLDSMTKETGYNNRSRFLRDAALNYNEQITSGDLENMDEGDTAEGTTASSVKMLLYNILVLVTILIFRKSFVTFYITLRD